MSSNLRDTIISCLKEISPEAAAIEITDESDPELDLGLDSLMGVELACEFSIRLGIEIALSDNPLICTDKRTGTKRLRKVGEIVEYLSTLPNLNNSSNATSSR